jgi:hypothetical protein
MLELRAERKAAAVAFRVAVLKMSDFSQKRRGRSGVSQVVERGVTLWGMCLARSEDKIVKKNIRTTNWTSEWTLQSSFRPEVHMAGGDRAYQ